MSGLRPRKKSTIIDEESQANLVADGETNIKIGGGLTVWLVIQVIAAVAAVGLLLGILIVVARYSGSHDCCSSSSDDDDDDGRSWSYAFQLSNRELNKIASRLRLSNWTGSTVVLTREAALREDINISFLDKPTTTAFGFYVFGSWRAFNQDGSIFDEGTEEFACFLGVDGVVYGSELRPDESAFVNMQLLQNNSLQFRIVESSDRTVSLALSGILEPMHSKK